MVGCLIFVMAPILFASQHDTGVECSSASDMDDKVSSLDEEVSEGVGNGW